MKNCFFDVHGIRTHYLEAGAPGQPLVVLLHGGGLDSAPLSWAPLIEALASDLHFIAPDWPGYGESGRPDVQYDLPFYVEFLTHLVEVLELPRPFCLAGLSLGGGAALGYALRHLENLQKLILVDPYGLQDRAPYHFISYLFIITPGVNALTWALFRNRSLLRWSLRSLLTNPQAITPELVELVYQEIQRLSLGMAWQRFQKNEIRWNGLKTVYMRELDRLNVPTLIVQGAKDALVPVRFVQEAQHRLPQAHLELIEDAGHWPQRDQPEAFNRLVGDFLRNTPSENG